MAAARRHWAIVIGGGAGLEGERFDGAHHMLPALLGALHFITRFVPKGTLMPKKAKSTI